MKRRALLTGWLLLATASAWSAQIYRWVDAEGRTHFSDRRPTDAVSHLVQSDSPERGSDTPTEEPNEAPAEPPNVGPYAVFDILAPAAGSILTQPTDSLSIKLLLEPPLIMGQRIELVLDGRPFASNPDSTQWQMTGIGFGAHRLQALIRDSLGAILAATPAHAFELRQATPPGMLP
jgi:hypothetical protein